MLTIVFISLSFVQPVCWFALERCLLLKGISFVGVDWAHLFLTNMGMNFRVPYKTGKFL
jgi:hypothetical protein